MNTTNIEWTDFTANPMKFREKDTGKIVWGCVKHSPGCAHCYAETLAKRYGRGGPFTKETMRGLEPFACEKELRAMLTHKPARDKMCFVGDMTDVFGEWVTDESLDKMFAVFACRPDVTWQVLTKRTERMAAYMDAATKEGGRWDHLLYDGRFEWPDADESVTNIGYQRITEEVPLSNVWLGTSTENQAAADERIFHLLKVPASVRFLSCEPLLGPVDLTKCWFKDRSGFWNALTGKLTCKITLNAGGEAWGETEQPLHPPINWVIVGGESGPGARPLNVAWVRSIVEQCKAAGVACFVKQLGAAVHDQWPIGSMPGPRLRPQDLGDGAFRIHPIDKKGGDISEFPTDLRVREFPNAR